ncbi:alpha/beta fold hydrolase [Paenibacillus harenae]|uniref:Pimeloyl-ACP methyl ester carboxylesterase n=1 Tax=Paenibacillus harenae TaxID=306543 RepID=A0ABT9U9J2_PAEHA|nr:alpha/beta hydrolase [Paenibacillus harenae]MDQ0116253.1 pimeloyl-ACP methyl ester carboxylesterase [Paenibacillus harenae]
MHPYPYRYANVGYMYDPLVYRYPLLPPMTWPEAAQVSDMSVGYEHLQRLTFVLVHGSWADASFWHPIAGQLRRTGHTVYTPDLPGHGSDPNKNVSHERIVDSLTEYITSRHLKDIVLAAHSFGGTVIQKVAERIPDRLKRLVFMNAFVLGDGQSLADQFPSQALALFEQLRQSSKDDTITLPFPLFRENFANLASLQLAEQLYRSTTPEPAAPAFTKLDLKKFYSLQTPKSYLYLTEDNVLPQTDQHSFHPLMSNRLGLHRLIKMPGDHMTTPNTDARRVAWKLYEAGRD